MSKVKHQSEGNSIADTKTIPKDPSTWWQWLLVYPALAIALLTSLPTLMEAWRSWKYGVPFGQSATAQKQDDFWKKNLSCTEAPPQWYVNEYNVRVDATICKSGDVLVKIMDPEGNAGYSWVSVARVIQKSVAISPVSEAYAEPPVFPLQLAQSGTSVICQRVISPGRILRRIRDSSGCYDEIINSYTGEVIQRYSAPCDSNC